MRIQPFDDPGEGVDAAEDAENAVLMVLAATTLAASGTASWSTARRKTRSAQP